MRQNRTSGADAVIHSNGWLSFRLTSCAVQTSPSVPPQRAETRRKKVQSDSARPCSTDPIALLQMTFPEDFIFCHLMSRFVICCHLWLRSVHPIQNGLVHFQPALPATVFQAQHAFQKSVMQTCAIRHGPSVSIFGPFWSLLKSAALAIPQFCLCGLARAVSARIFTAEKKNFGKEKVKFWMLYQPLTSMASRNRSKR
jgi:hypothetical protein